MVVEQLAIGGQAGTSSLIRDYLGFPRGLSGGELAHRAWQQAVLFGAQFVFTHRAIRFTPSADHHLDDRSEAAAQAVILATGVTYRRLGIAGLERFVGTGVFYGAASVSVERTRPARQLCTSRSSPAGLPCWSVGSHWPQACPTTSSGSGEGSVIVGSVHRYLQF